MKVRSTVRYREDTGWECQCPECSEYLPLDAEFWEPKRGMTRCRGCWRANDRAVQRARYRASPEWAEKKRQKARQYRRETSYERTRARLRWQEIRQDPLLLDQQRERNRLAMRRLRARRRLELAA